MAIALESAGYAVVPRLLADLGVPHSAIVVVAEDESEGSPAAEVLSAIERTAGADRGRCVVISKEGLAADAYRRAGACVIAAPFLRRDLVEALEMQPDSSRA